MTFPSEVSNQYKITPEKHFHPAHTKSLQKQAAVTHYMLEQSSAGCHEQILIFLYLRPCLYYQEKRHSIWQLNSEFQYATPIFGLVALEQQVWIRVAVQQTCIHGRLKSEKTQMCGSIA